MSSSTHKRMSRKAKGKKATGDCPLQDKEPHNSPDWYTREYIPLIGANYNILSNVGVEPRLMNNGMQLNTAVVHDTILSIPVDDSFSAYRQINLLWEDLREMNSGAINYSPQKLAAYAFNILTMRALCYYVHRAFAALRYKSPLMRDSPQVYLNVAGFGNYSTEVAAYAANWNRASFLFHDIEQIPIVPYTFLDRVKFIYSTIFTDSPTTRPAMIAFRPRVYFTYDVNTAGDEVTATRVVGGTPSGENINAVLNSIESIYDTLVNDNAYATIRGDMMKAFGSGCLKNDLVTGLAAQLNIGYNEDVACQLENATVASFTTTTVALNLSVANMTATITATPPTVHDGAPFRDPNHVINFHGATAPRDGALLGLTRLVAVGNYSGSGDVTITAASGIIVKDTYFITDTRMNGGPTNSFLNALLADTYSTIQSTAVAAYKKLCGLVSLVDRFPMVVLDRDDPFGFLFDVDNFTILDNNTLGDFAQVANRSLLAVRVPRGENMSTRKYMIQ